MGEEDQEQSVPDPKEDHEVPSPNPVDLGEADAPKAEEAQEATPSDVQSQEPELGEQNAERSPDGGGIEDSL